jgi:acetylornithine deacetylase/succinyl-diaminopimelate desuccinylase-like protein
MRRVNTDIKGEKPMTQSALEYAQAHQADNLDHLFDLLRIPSISTSAERQDDIRRAGDWLVTRMREIGLSRAETMPTAGHPVVYGEWLRAGPDAPTLLIYGHYDVQPTDPDEEWTSPPFEPTIQGDLLYARGASDNKGQHYTHLAATEAFFRAEGAPPVNLKFLIEGEEEIGSPNLRDFIRANADMLACDVSLISDTGMVEAKTPTIICGVRGMAYMEVVIQGPKQDLHSGAYGGVAHNPLQVMVEILAALHDDQGRVAIPGFYDKVRPLTDDERDEFKRIPFDEETFRQEIGAPVLWTGEAGYTPLERLGARPTLEIHGIRGGFVGEGQKTVIPAKIAAKISMRLVPDQDPLEIAQLFEQRIRALAPPSVEVSVRTLSYADAAVVDRDTPAMGAAVRAYRRGFDAEPVFLRAGGTLPVVAMLNKVLKAPVIMMGFGLPDDNAHAPNEKLSLDNFRRGINTSIHFMEELVATYES